MPGCFVLLMYRENGDLTNLLKSAYILIECMQIGSRKVPQSARTVPVKWTPPDGQICNYCSEDHLVSELRGMLVC